MAHVDLLAMDCTAASCFLKSCDQAFLAVGIIQVEIDVLRLKLGADVLQHFCSPSATQVMDLILLP